MKIYRNAPHFTESFGFIEMLRIFRSQPFESIPEYDQFFCGSGPRPAIKNVCHSPCCFEGEAAGNPKDSANLRISAFLFFL